MNRLCSVLPYLEVRTVKTGDPKIPEQGIRQPVGEGTIHVWSAWYADLEPNFPYYSEQLSREEMLKAAGYKKSTDSRHYILRHGMVRAVLGYYLGRDPGKIQFMQGMNGKPALDPENSSSDIRFSLSRTGERVCLGITRKSDIGLDIVKVQTRYPFFAIESYLFTPGEKEWIAQGAPDRRAIRFFRIWSLKEALLKVTGSNARVMQDVDVSGVLTDRYLNGCYALNIWEKKMNFFIHEEGCGAGHHRVIATLKEI